MREGHEFIGWGVSTGTWDWKSNKQTDQPWKSPVEKEQQSGTAKEDLEKWKDTNTH
jgi:hypothetical protein